MCLNVNELYGISSKNNILCKKTSSSRTRREMKNDFAKNIMNRYRFCKHLKSAHGWEEILPVEMLCKRVRKELRLISIPSVEHVEGVFNCYFPFSILLHSVLIWVLKRNLPVVCSPLVTYKSSTLQGKQFFLCRQQGIAGRNEQFNWMYKTEVENMYERVKEQTKKIGVSASGDQYLNFYSIKITQRSL